MASTSFTRSRSVAWYRCRRPAAGARSADRVTVPKLGAGALRACPEDPSSPESALRVWSTGRKAESADDRWPPDRVRPVIPATKKDPSTATAARASTTRRDGHRNVHRGPGGSSARTSARSPLEATGRDVRSSSASLPNRSSTSSSGDTGAHLLLQLLQRAAQPRRARRRADPEHSRRGLAVELEHDPQSDDLPLSGGQPRQRRFECRRQPLAEDLLRALGHRNRVAALSPPPPVLRAKVVERRRARQLAEPRPRTAAPRVEAVPALARAGECLGRERLGGSFVSGQVHELG